MRTFSIRSGLLMNETAVRHPSNSVPRYCTIFRVVVTASPQQAGMVFWLGVDVKKMRAGRFELPRRFPAGRFQIDRVYQIPPRPQKHKGHGPSADEIEPLGRCPL